MMTLTMTETTAMMMMETPVKEIATMKVSRSPLFILEEPTDSYPSSDPALPSPTTDFSEPGEPGPQYPEPPTSDDPDETDEPAPDLPADPEESPATDEPSPEPTTPDEPAPEPST